jgi:tetratricopeptide (TPR) repeat protein
MNQKEFTETPPLVYGGAQAAEIESTSFIGASNVADPTSVGDSIIPGASPLSPIILCNIDSPSKFIFSGQSLRVFGWAAASEPIISLQISIDDIPLTTVQCGLMRPDVANVHPDIAGAASSGFLGGPIDFPRNADALTITVTVTLASGHKHRTTRKSWVVNDFVEFIEVCRRARDLRLETLTGFARILAEGRRFGEAECVLAFAVMRFPDSLDAWCEFANIEVCAVAAGEGSEDEALRRWQMVQQQFFDASAPYLGEARTLISIGRFAEADALLQRILLRWPDFTEAEGLHADLPIRLASSARTDERRPLYVDAHSRWAAFRTKYPDHPAGYLQGAEALMKCNEFTTAELLLVLAKDRFPDQWEAMACYAAVATMRGDSLEAVSRWQAARQRFPNVPQLAAREQQARNEVAYEEERSLEKASVKHVSSDSALDSPSALELPDDELMMMFEGLGVNCDFGSVQRHFGAEPLGLLRFAGVELDKLLEALAIRFEGIGYLENTVLDLRPHPQPEYWLGDKRFTFFMHTFIFPEHLPTKEKKREILDKSCRRLTFLAKKLVSDLCAAEKIFVYQRDAIAWPEIQMLFTALCEYGPNTLLCVGPSNVEHPAGSVELVEPRLIRGYLKSFNVAGSGDQLDVENWRKVCRKAYALQQADRNTSN